jgi:hypothetical protein
MNSMENESQATELTEKTSLRARNKKLRLSWVGLGIHQAFFRSVKRYTLHLKNKAAQLEKQAQDLQGKTA